MRLATRSPLRRAAPRTATGSDHGLAEVLGIGSPVPVEHHDPVRGSIVFDDAGVVHRDVGRPLLELLRRVSAVAHHAQHEAVRIEDGVGGRRRTSPDAPPLVGVASARQGRQRANVQLLAATLPVLQLGFRGPAAVALADGSVVLGAEPPRRASRFRCFERSQTIDATAATTATTVIKIQAHAGMANAPSV